MQRAMNALMRNQHPRHRIDVDRYYAMVTEGVLAEDARVELIDGVIVDMPPIGCPHGAMVDCLTRRLGKVLDEHAWLRVQGVVRLDRFSEPQPDLALLVPRKGYGECHPRPEDVLLIIEVSDSTLRYDLDIKLPLYARHEIPEVWIVDIGGGLIHFFRSPRGGRFSENSSTENPGIVSLAALPEVHLDLTDVFEAT